MSYNSPIPNNDNKFSVNSDYTILDNINNKRCGDYIDHPNSNKLDKKVSKKFKEDNTSTSKFNYNNNININHNSNKFKKSNDSSSSSEDSVILKR